MRGGTIKFVPPRIGILEEAASRRHLFVFGRRGVGKSTLLRKLEQERELFGAEVLFIDVETLRDRPYPDVLIELLIELLGALDHGLSQAQKQNGGQARIKGLPSRWRLRRLRSRLRVLLTEPQQAVYTVRELQRREGSGALGLILPPIKGVWAWVRARYSHSRENQQEAQFTATKMEACMQPSSGFAWCSTPRANSSKAPRRWWSSTTSTTCRSSISPRCSPIYIRSSRTSPSISRSVAFATESTISSRDIHRLGCRWGMTPVTFRWI
jgi:hypothetical protein